MPHEVEASKTVYHSLPERAEPRNVHTTDTADSMRRNDAFETQEAPAGGSHESHRCPRRHSPSVSSAIRDINRLPYNGEADHWFDPAWLVAGSHRL
jgi:hypothetical protein